MASNYAVTRLTGKPPSQDESVKKFFVSAARTAVMYGMCVCVTTGALAQNATAPVLPDEPAPTATVLIAQNDAGNSQNTQSTVGAGTNQSAGQTSATPQNDGAQNPPARTGTVYTTDEQLKKEEQQRVAGVMPAFNVSFNFDAPPLTPKQKFALTMHQNFDWFVFATAAIAAGNDELGHSYSGYGWGAQGYLKRFGAEYANTFDGNLFGNAILPTLLHQDPRYFRLGQGSFTKRFFYSASTTFITRGDNGHKEFNFSNIGGNVIAGGIANVYYPSSQRGVGQTFDSAFTVTLEGMIGAELDEFWPDIAHKLFKKHLKKLGEIGGEEPDMPTTSTPAK